MRRASSVTLEGRERCLSALRSVIAAQNVLGVPQILGHMFALLLFTLLATGLALCLARRRRARLDNLPPGLGVWVTDVESTEARAARRCGLTRQVRVCLRPGRGCFESDELVREVRYQSELTGAIVRMDPEEVLKRPRASR